MNLKNVLIILPLLVLLGCTGNEIGDIEGNFNYLSDGGFSISLEFLNKQVSSETTETISQYKKNKTLLLTDNNLQTFIVPVPIKLGETITIQSSNSKDSIFIQELTENTVTFVYTNFNGESSTYSTNSNEFIETTGGFSAKLGDFPKQTGKVTLKILDKELILEQGEFLPIDDEQIIQLLTVAKIDEINDESELIAFIKIISKEENSPSQLGGISIDSTNPTITLRDGTIISLISISDSNNIERFVENGFISKSDIVKDTVN